MSRPTTAWVFGFLIVLSLSACVDTVQPEGPNPDPDPDPGELTSAVTQSDSAISWPARPAGQP